MNNTTEKKWRRRESKAPPSRRLTPSRTVTPSENNGFARTNTDKRGAARSDRSNVANRYTSQHLATAAASVATGRAALWGALCGGATGESAAKVRRALTITTAIEASLRRLIRPRHGGGWTVTPRGGR